MKKFLCLILIGLLAGNAFGGTLTGEEQAYYRSLSVDGNMFGWCQQASPIAGGWEYWIDFYSSGNNDGWRYWIGGFDVSGIQNYADGTNVRDIWIVRRLRFSGLRCEREFPFGDWYSVVPSITGETLCRRSTPTTNSKSTTNCKAVLNYALLTRRTRTLPLLRYSAVSLKT